MGTACTESTVFHTCAVANNAMQPKCQDTKPERIEQTVTCKCRKVPTVGNKNARQVQGTQTSPAGKIALLNRPQRKRSAESTGMACTVEYHTVYSACAVANIAMLESVTRIA